MTGAWGRTSKIRAERRSDVADNSGVFLQQRRARVGGRRRLEAGVEPVVAALHGAIGIAEDTKNLVHLAFDARHLAQADRMDLIGGERRGGVGAQRDRVGLRAPRQPPQAGGVRGPRQLRGEQVANAAVRGQDRGAHGPFRFGHKGDAVDGGQILHFGGPFGERRHEHVGDGLTAQEAIDLPERGRQNEARRDEILFRAGRRLRDTVIEQGANLSEADEVVFNVAAMADGVGLAEEVDQGDLQSAKLMKNEPVIGERSGLHDALKARLKNAGRGALKRCEGGAIVGAEFRQDPLRLFQASLPLRRQDWKVGDVIPGRELAVERILLRPGKILLIGCRLRIASHPILRGAFGEPVKRLRRRRGTRRKREREKSYEVGPELHGREAISRPRLGNPIFGRHAKGSVVEREFETNELAAHGVPGPPGTLTSRGGPGTPCAAVERKIDPNGNHRAF